MSKKGSILSKPSDAVVSVSEGLEGHATGAATGGEDMSRDIPGFIENINCVMQRECYGIRRIGLH